MYHFCVQIFVFNVKFVLCTHITVCNSTSFILLCISSYENTIIYVLIPLLISVCLFPLFWPLQILLLWTFLCLFWYIYVCISMWHTHNFVSSVYLYPKKVQKIILKIIIVRLEVLTGSTQAPVKKELTLLGMKGETLEV